MNKLLKLSTISIGSILLLSACNFNFIISGDDDSGSQTSHVNQSNETSKSDKTSFGKNITPIYGSDTIKSNIGSYSSTFTITTYDGVYNFNVKYDKDLNAGVVNREGEDFYFIRVTDDEYLVYYENEYGYGYSPAYSYDYSSFRLNLLYMNLIFDITSDLQENAPYASKEEITYANRKATKYVVKDSKYILPLDTKLNIILDNETGAILSLTYDHLNFYETTSFTPNDTNASKVVNDKRNNEVTFDFYSKPALSLVGLEDISLPNWYEYSATFSYLSKDNKDISNMNGYSVQYYSFMDDTSAIEKVAKSIYEKGIKYNYDNVLTPFNDLYESTRSTVNYTVIDAVRFNGCVNKNGKKYNVVFQGTNRSDTPREWFITLAINLITE